MWSFGYQAASWSEYVGPVVGGTSTYIAGKNGLLNQNTGTQTSDTEGKVFNGNTTYICSDHDGNILSITQNIGDNTGIFNIFS